MVGCRKSSASAYAASHLSLSVLAILSSAGFSTSSSNVLNLLTEVLQRYIQLLATSCVQHASHSGRNVIVPQDLRIALEHILGGDPIEEVLEWAEEEGRLDLDQESNAYSQIPSSSHPSLPNRVVHSSLQNDIDRDALRNPSPASNLRNRLVVGRPRPASPDPRQELHYIPIPPEMYETLEQDAQRRQDTITNLVWNETNIAKAKSTKGKEKEMQLDAMDMDETIHVSFDSASTLPSFSDSESDLFTEDEIDSLESAPTDAGQSNGIKHRGTYSNGLHSPSAEASISNSASDQRSRSNSKPKQVEYVRRIGSLSIDYVPPYLPAFPLKAMEKVQFHSFNDLDGKHGADESKVDILIKDGDADDMEMADIHQEADAEYVEEKRRTQAAIAASANAAKEAATNDITHQGDGEAATDTVKKEKTAEERAAEAEKAFEALQARRVLRDCWREAAPFDSSALAATYPSSELETVDAILADHSGGSALVGIAPPTSSLGAFAADFRALAEDPTTSGAAGIFLTSEGVAYQEAAAKRRRLAHGIADPSRYTPNDSLYASIGARPATIPFQPGPSWLVSTLPPPTLYEDNQAVANALSAPILTPVHPQGRPASLVPPSGTLVPTLAYRHPAHLSIGARIVSNAELLKKVSRYDDPPPLVDDKHAERFFHGVPASRDLLGGSMSSSDLSSNISSSRKSGGGGGGSGSGNTTLRSALEKLVLQMQQKEAQILPKEDKEELQRRQQELQLQIQAALTAESSGKGSTSVSSGLIGDSYASRIRNGNITMVHTWDWTIRDPYDASLPGKRIGASERKAIAPISLEKGRRESVLLDGTNGSGGDHSVHGV